MRKQFTRAVVGKADCERFWSVNEWWELGAGTGGGPVTGDEDQVLRGQELQEGLPAEGNDSRY